MWQKPKEYTKMNLSNARGGALELVKHRLEYLFGNVAEHWRQVEEALDDGQRRRHTIISSVHSRRRGGFTKTRESESWELNIDRLPLSMIALDVCRRRSRRTCGARRDRLSVGTDTNSLR